MDSELAILALFLFGGLFGWALGCAMGRDKERSANRFAASTEIWKVKEELDSEQRRRKKAEAMLERERSGG